MPGFYPEDEYDLAGFTVGVVDKSRIVDRERVQPGDVILGLSSSGVHSNGFSLVRKVFDLTSKEAVERFYPELGSSLGECLLAPTKIYVKPMLELMRQVSVKSVSHITGGGFYENIPRALNEHVKMCIRDRDCTLEGTVACLEGELGQIEQTANHVLEEARCV